MRFANLRADCRRLPLTACLAAVVLAGPLAMRVQADDRPAVTRQATIELTDKSTIIGEIIEMKDGKYRVKTTGMGEVEIENGVVKSIRYGDAAGTPDGAATAKAADVNAQDVDINKTVDASAMRVVSNPEMLKSVEGLLEDPDILAVFDDEEIMKAAQEGDYAKLMASPAIQKLVDSPAMKKVVASVLAPEGGAGLSPVPATPATGADAATPAAPVPTPAVKAPAPAVLDGMDTE